MRPSYERLSIRNGTLPTTTKKKKWKKKKNQNLSYHVGLRAFAIHRFSSSTSFSSSFRLRFFPIDCCCRFYVRWICCVLLFVLTQCCCCCWITIPKLYAKNEKYKKKTEIRKEKAKEKKKTFIPSIWTFPFWPFIQWLVSDSHRVFLLHITLSSSIFILYFQKEKSAREKHTHYHIEERHQALNTANTRKGMLFYFFFFYLFSVHNKKK